MPKRYANVPIDSQTYDRVHALRGRITDLCLRGEQQIGIGVAFGLLMDHWEKNPPSIEWLREQIRLYPGRGRPRKSEEGAPLLIRHGKKDVLGGHDFIEHPRHKHSLWCTKCTSWWNTMTDPMPLHSCARVKPHPSIRLGLWKKSELLALGWYESEVGWAADG